MNTKQLPLVKPESPYVGTGLEGKVAIDSGLVIVAPEAGVIKEVDASHIVLKTDKGKEINFDMLKFVRSNAFTCVKLS